MNQELNNIWTVFYSAIGFLFIYGMSGIIWAVRLEGKVKSNRALIDSNEKLFKMFLENSEKKDEKIEESIDKLFEYQREIEKTVNRINGHEPTAI